MSTGNTEETCPQFNLITYGCNHMDTSKSGYECLHAELLFGITRGDLLQSNLCRMQVSQLSEEQVSLINYVSVGWKHIKELFQCNLKQP